MVKVANTTFSPPPLPHETTLFFKSFLRSIFWQLICQNCFFSGIVHLSTTHTTLFFLHFQRLSLLTPTKKIPPSPLLFSLFFWCPFLKFRMKKYIYQKRFLVVSSSNDFPFLPLCIETRLVFFFLLRKSRLFLLRGIEIEERNIFFTVALNINKYYTVACGKIMRRNVVKVEQIHCMRWLFADGYRFFLEVGLFFSEQCRGKSVLLLDVLFLFLKSPEMNKNNALVC